MSISTLDKDSVAVVYTHYRTENNRAVYIGPLHSDLVKDTMIISSAAPKRNGVSFGNRRSSINLITTVIVDDVNGVPTSKDMKVELSVSLPAGVTTDTLKESLARVAHILTTTTTSMELLHIGKIEV